MPPMRNVTPLAKPQKTERSHEENQERAYIAASRRSDRSLEARVESARRASEIHKRRTGRSLRVTEQDVINEEMYEEEDDDLPMQYRRLTAHLQTSNAEFDRKLAAYLTNHVAMRTALGQAVQQSTQAYPNATQFAMQSPMQGQSVFGQQNQMQPPQVRSPSMYRQSPYPTVQQGMHNRSASIASPNEPNKSANNDSRRNSTPAHAPPTPNGQPPAKRYKSIHNLKLENLPNSASFMLSPPKSESGSLKTPSPPQQLKPSEFPAPFDMSGSNMNFMGNGMSSMPFSTMLPPESQQLLGGAFDLNDPMTAMLMGPDFKPGAPFYSTDKSKTQDFDNTTYTGMNQTLAPGFLDTSVGGFNAGMGPDSAFSEQSPFATSAGGYGMGFDSSYNDAFKPIAFGNSGLNSGEATPSGEWQSFINGSAWDDVSSSQPTAS